LPNLLRQRLAEERVLDRLTENGVAAILEGRTGRRPPPALVSLVYSETEGNPFFVEEVFRHLDDSGKLLDDKGQFRSGIQIGDTEVPRGVRLVISQRLQNLSESCRLMLTRAAALGQNLDFDLIAALADLEEDVLLDALDEAEEAAIIRDSSSDRDVRYIFIHEQIRQTLLAELSTPRRQRLHLRVADTMEQLHGAYVEEQATEIAHHLYQAGAAADGARTARYFILAGERARGASAFDEAIRMFDAAETVLPAEDRNTRAHILYCRGMAFRGAAQMDRALTTFQGSIDLLPPGGDRDRAVIARAQLLLDLFRGQEAVDDFERLLADAREKGDTDLELTSLLGLGRAYYVISLNESGGGERALESYEQAYTLARKSGDKAGMVRALIPTNHLVDYWPDFRTRAIANMEEAVRLAEEVGDEGLILDSTQVRLRFLSPREAHSEGQELLDRLKSRRDPLRLKEHYFHLMWHYRSVGEFSRGVEACDKGIGLAEQLGVPPVQYPTLKALALVNLGRYGDAWDALQCEITEEPLGYVMQQYGMVFFLADLLAFEEAAVQARKVVTLSSKLDRAWMRTGVQNLCVSALARSSSLNDDTLAEVEQDVLSYGGTLGKGTMAEVMLMEGSPGEALVLADDLCTARKQSGSILGWIPALELKLRTLLALDDADEALVVADEAVSQAEETGYQSIAWRILAGRARARSATGDAGGAMADYRAASSIIRRLAETITDAELRQGFETSPLVTPILAEGEKGA